MMPRPTRSSRQMCDGLGSCAPRHNVGVRSRARCARNNTFLGTVGPSRRRRPLSRPRKIVSEITAKHDPSRPFEPQRPARTNCSTTRPSRSGEKSSGLLKGPDQPASTAHNPASDRTKRRPLRRHRSALTRPRTVALLGHPEGSIMATVYWSGVGTGSWTDRKWDRFDSYGLPTGNHAPPAAGDDVVLRRGTTLGSHGDVTVASVRAAADSTLDIDGGRF